MKTLLALLFILFHYTYTFGQRSLPYPIILIHGYTGDVRTGYWNELTSTFTNAGLKVESNYLSYALNADNNLLTSQKEVDVVEMPYSIENKDVYLIDFARGNLGNQSGIVKQGYAIKMAIRRVLDATKAKKVILFGHSMGGLAAREYLQNQSNWQSDGNHHVAKLVTMGTPHLGSNMGSSGLNLGLLFKGYDEKSESVRDLRTDYKTGRKGVYLFGGYENASFIQSGLPGGHEFYNLDVNCNGREGDLVKGLNEKDLYTNLSYSCIIGLGAPGIQENDGVVLSSSQNLNNLYKLNAEIFYYQCPILDGLLCHTREPAKALLESMYALDEPNTKELAYEVDLNDKDVRKGFFTRQANSNSVDKDIYKLEVPSSGFLDFYYNGMHEANVQIKIVDPTNRIIKIPYGNNIHERVDHLSKGTYYVEIEGWAGSGWNSYNYMFSFCPTPESLGFVSMNGPLSFCQGGSVTLTCDFDSPSYQWYKDDIIPVGTAKQLTVKESGYYSVKIKTCSSDFTSVSVGVKVNPSPTKPIITVQENPFALKSSKASNYQWYASGMPVNGANQQIFTQISTGSYSVKVSESGCSSESDPFVITNTDPQTEAVKIYPNPTQGIFVVELPKNTSTTVKIVNSSGIQVYQKNVKWKEQIDVSSLASGLYTIQYTIGGDVISQKILIQK